MTKVKNITGGPKGIRLAAPKGQAGPIVMLEPGETKDLDIADGEDGQTDWFSFGGTDKADDGEKQVATSDDIKAAIGLLDGANDEHWTAAGLPSVDAVAELAGKPTTRAAINEAAPEAKRPAN
jgi:hypothetical protein